MADVPWKTVRRIAEGAAADPDWVATATNPDHSFSPPAPNGQVAGGIALAWVVRDSAGAYVAPVGTYSYRLMEYLDDQSQAPSPLAYAGATVAAASFTDVVRIPQNPGAGARYAVQITAVAGLPVGGSAELRVKGLVE